MKKIKVSKEACIGCGACVAIDPEHFEFNDEGLSHPVNQENLDSSDLASAMDACPTSAISFDENENCECDTCECDECHCNDDCDCGDCECEECHCTADNNCGCHCYEEE